MVDPATAPDPERARRLLSRCEDLFRWAADERREVEDEWDEIEDAFYGLSPVRVEDELGDLRDLLGLKLPPPRSAAQLGLTRPVVSQLVAVMVQEPLRVAVTPRGDELTHQVLALAAQGLADHWKDTQDLDGVAEQLALLVCLRNAAYTSFGWNPYDGPPDPYASGEKQGEIFIRAMDSREAYVDPSSTRLLESDAGFFIRERTMSTGAVPAAIRRASRAIKEAGDGAAGAGVVARARSVARSLAATFYGPATERVGGRTSVVRETFIRPGAGYFDDERERAADEAGLDDDAGLFFLTVDGEAPFPPAPLPYIEDGVVFPFAIAPYIDDPTRVYGPGVALLLARNDVIINHLANLDLDYQRAGRKPKLITSPDADLRGRFAAEGFELVETDLRQGDYTWIEGPPITAADHAVREMIVAHSKFAAGAPDVYFGESPERVSTATGMQIAKGGAELRARLVKGHIRRAIRQAMQACLSIAAHRYHAPRMVETTGSSYPVRQMMIAGYGLDRMELDLKDDPTFSSNPTLRAMQVVQILGAVPPGTFSPEEIRGWLRLPQSETALFNEDDLDRAEAEAQAYSVLIGEAGPETLLVRPGVDNDKIHIKAKRTWLKTGVGRWAHAYNPAGWKAVASDIAMRTALLTGALSMAGPQPVGGDEGLTPQEGGGKGASEMGQQRPADGVEEMLGRVSPAEMNADAGQVLANRERTNGGLT